VKQWMVAVVMVAIGWGSQARADQKIIVSAAASLKEVVEEIAGAYSRETKVEVRLNLGASGQLAAQIEAGAPVDLFVSAGQEQIARLADKKLVDPKAVRIIARNQLVLIGERGTKLQSIEQLKDAGIMHLAMGDPETVPAGEYARQSLKALGLWEKVQPKLVYGASVRQVLDYVAHSEAEAGFVYATDARMAEVKVVAMVAAKMHEPIVYPAAIIKGQNEREAAGFVGYLGGPVARKILREHGFETE